MPVLQVYGGPSNHYWQDFTNKMLKGRKDNTSVVKKLLLDNLVFSPVYNVLMMTYISAGAALRLHLRGVILAKSCLCCTFPAAGPVILCCCDAALHVLHMQWWRDAVLHTPGTNWPQISLSFNSTAGR